MKTYHLIIGLLIASFVGLALMPAAPKPEQKRTVFLDEANAAGAIRLEAKRAAQRAEELESERRKASIIRRTKAIHEKAPWLTKAEATALAFDALKAEGRFDD